jgi:tRNA (guanine-N7-)-methyltransferase
MTRKKLKHFAEMKEWSHVLEPEWGGPSGLAGTWGGAEDSAMRPVILELACGKGYYTLAVAERRSDAVVVGVDIKGARIWHGAEVAKERGMENVRFLRTRIEDLAQHFADGEVAEIWITFPDPHPREGKEKKRLTGRRFLEIYRQVLRPGGKLHLKTDDDALFEWTLEVLREEERAGRVAIEEVIWDVYSEDELDGDFAELLHVKTQYEEKFLKKGRTIKYLRFKV